MKKTLIFISLILNFGSTVFGMTTDDKGQKRTHACMSSSSSSSDRPHDEVKRPTTEKESSDTQDNLSQKLARIQETLEADRKMEKKFLEVILKNEHALNNNLQSSMKQLYDLLQKKQIPQALPFSTPLPSRPSSPIVCTQAPAKGWTLPQPHVVNNPEEQKILLAALDQAKTGDLLKACSLFESIKESANPLIKQQANEGLDRLNETVATIYG